MLTETERAIATRLADELYAFNRERTGVDDFDELLLHDDDGGLYGWNWGGTFWVDTLFVREGARGRGLGGRLLREAEAEARRRGCHQLALNTHSFQAPAFYERHGFELVGAIADFPIGHTRFSLRKPLA